MTVSLDVSFAPALTGLPAGYVITTEVRHGAGTVVLTDAVGGMVATQDIYAADVDGLVRTANGSQ